jgi:hypothetical protein
MNSLLLCVRVLSCTVKKLDWMSSGSYPTLERPHVLFAADVIHPLTPNSVLEALLDTVEALLLGSAVFFLAYVPRDGKTTLRRFVSACCAVRLQVTMFAGHVCRGAC